MSSHYVFYREIVELCCVVAERPDASRQIIVRPYWQRRYLILDFFLKPSQNDRLFVLLLD